METEEVIKLVDNIYKNILEKFNPGARQLISTGKAYLKALHGAAAAARLFNESLAKIAINAQQGGTTDIGSALMNIVGVYKEIQDQHMNILKAFYVDLLVPLETNLEKDTKVVQFEQKKFLQLHKVRADSYSKAAATMKKYRKKNKTTQAAAEKEIKSIQALDEEKNKLDLFCEQSLKNAMTQERRRYGFVLERQCSLAKHWMAYHNAGYSTIESNVEHWNDVAATREFLPPNVENMFVKKMRHHIDDDDSDPGSTMSTLRKTRSIDASCLDMRSLGDVANSSNMQMPRAKSEYALNGTTNGNDSKHWDRPIVKALYAYLSSGENQLSFLEGDRIALVGDRAKGWQFGENLRTQKFGWFPIAYTEIEYDETNSSYWSKSRNEQELEQMQDLSMEGTVIEEVSHKVNAAYNDDASPTRMFGDTIQYRTSKQFRRVSRGQPPKPGPPPTLPAPVPTPVVPESYTKQQQQQQQQQQGLTQSHSFSSSGGAPVVEKRKTGPATMNYSKPPTGNKGGKTSRNGATNASLHSSNDSGFSNSNEPKNEPEIDYSDEETLTRVPIRSRSEKNIHEHRDHMSILNNEEIYGQAPFKQSTLNMRTAASYSNLNHQDDRSMDTLYRSNADLSGKNVKRTKSFWKFSKSEDILEGMALWKHKDLVPTEKEKLADEKREATLKRNMRKKAKQQQDHQHKEVNNNSPTAQQVKPRPHSMAIMEEHSTPPPPYQMTKAEIDQRISKHNQTIYEQEKTTTLTKPTKGSKTKERSSGNGKPTRPYKNDVEPDEHEIYGDASTLQRDARKDKHRSKTGNSGTSAGDMHMWNGQKMKDYQDSDSTLKRSLDDFSMIINDSMRMQENFYDDESIEDIMMKTVKRKEILKQYYSSGTDTERNSTSSDPYDCIVVDDHLVSAADMMIKNNKENLNRSRKTDKQQQQMEFSTFRGEGKTAAKEKSGAGQRKEVKEREGQQTGTLLPRTKLSKTGGNGQGGNDSGRKYDSDADVREKQRLVKQREALIKQSYGPWYDLWDKQNGIQK